VNQKGNTHLEVRGGRTLCNGSHKGEEVVRDHSLVTCRNCLACIERRLVAPLSDGTGGRE